MIAALHVELVGNDGLGLRDLLIPIVAFIGGLLGIVLGGRINRATLTRLEDKRDTRERDLASQRVEREADLDRAQARREWETERRRALGAAKLLRHELTERSLMLQEARSADEWWPASQQAVFELPATEAPILAAWLSDAAWGYTVEALAYLASIDRIRQQIADNPLRIGLPSDQSRTIEGAISTIADALRTFEGGEIDALSSATPELPEYLAAPTPPPTTRGV